MRSRARALHGTWVMPPWTLGMVRSPEVGSPNVRLVAHAGARHPCRTMQVLQPQSSRPSVVGTSRTLVTCSVGVALVFGGIWLGIQEMSSSTLAELVLRARPGAVGTTLAALGWAFGILAPAALVLAGSLRLGRALGPALETRRPNPYLRIVRGLPAGQTAALGVRLPDGRYLPAVVIGPQGVVVLERLPPPAALRRVDGRWEARLRDRGWTAIEDPRIRCERDAEALRRWLGEDDVDYVVKVHAAVIDDKLSVGRTAGCAIVTSSEVAEFIAALPVQRQLTEARRERVVARIRSAIS